jgi:hypothetical protein
MVDFVGRGDRLFFAMVAGAKIRGGIVDPPAHRVGVGGLAQRSSGAGITRRAQRKQRRVAKLWCVRRVSGPKPSDNLVQHSCANRGAVHLATPSVGWCLHLRTDLEKAPDIRRTLETTDTQ